MSKKQSPFPILCLGSTVGALVGALLSIIRANWLAKTTVIPISESHDVVNTVFYVTVGGTCLGTIIVATSLWCRKKASIGALIGLGCLSTFFGLLMLLLLSITIASVARFLYE